ncbi:peptidase family m48 domain-containing protein [Ditylenchus destructor]|nr:peptidase family m48 domain-containing protein [Ditylenchus destructor]
MAATFPVAFMLFTIAGGISFQVDSIVDNVFVDVLFYVFAAIAISGCIGICLLILKPIKYSKIIFLWMLSVAVVYIMTDVVSPLLEHRKHFPKDALETQITNLSQSVGFPPNNIYISKFGKDYGIANDGVAYQAGIFLHHRIVFMDKPIFYSYDELKDDEVTNFGANAEEAAGDKNATSPHMGLRTLMKIVRSSRSNKNRVKGILAHELGHWTYHHTLLDFIGVGVRILL